MRSISLPPQTGTAFRLAAALLVCTLIFSGCAATTTQTKRETASATSQPSSNADPQLQKRFDAAVALMRQDQTSKAKQTLLALIDQNPDLAGPYINLGIIHLNEGEPNKAEASFSKALQLKPDSVPAHNQLGVALRMQGKFQAAEQAYRSALQIEPDYQLTHRNLGILYDLYLTKPQLALQHYKRCQTLSHSNDKEIGGWILDLERRIKSAK